MTSLRYITHPNVHIDPDVPVSRWGLNDEGRRRAKAMLSQPWIPAIRRIVSSNETKALETAEILANHLGLSVEIRPGIGENDRTATGFIPPDEFEELANAFFARPEDSVRGWERAIDAQARLVANLADLLDPGEATETVVVGHGAVGTLWYCHLTGQDIDRRYDQPSQGHYFTVDLATRSVIHPWHPIDRHPPGHLIVDPASSFESVSTWKQDEPSPASPSRTRILDNLAQHILSLNAGRLTVAVDGYTASGKTSFAHELAAHIRRLGRSTLRASLDDFKKPWRDAIAKGYDRVSGEGYYRNAPDFDSAQKLLLEPASRTGSGIVALCGHDPLTGIDHRDATVQATADAVLIVDSVFAFRPEYNSYWDYRIWIDITPELSLQRGIQRDGDMEGRAEAERLHQDRYHASEQIYITEVDPKLIADIIIDNTDYANPVVQGPHADP